MNRPSVLTLGNFDGPHLGHIAILEQARRLADSRGAVVVAGTFDPPPVEILRPGHGPPRLAPLEQRKQALIAGGVDEVVVFEPTAEWLSQSPETFVAGLVERFNPAAILEGPDFRFGRGRAGDMAVLGQLGQQHGFEAITVPRLSVTLANRQPAPVSSSLIRWLIGRGRMADAAACLGRAFSLTATVVQGEQRGRTIDVPTANLDPQTLAPMMIPADGVYAGFAEIIDDANSSTSSPAETRVAFPAAISVGMKPTFGQSRLTVEAHLLDFREDLYGRTLKLSFARWLREQYPFPGVTSLRSQLMRDIDRVQRLGISELTRLPPALQTTCP